MWKLLAAGAPLLAAMVCRPAIGQTPSGLLPRSTVPPPTSAFGPTSPYPSTSTPAAGQPLGGQPLGGNAAVTSPPPAQWRTPGVAGGNSPPPARTTGAAAAPASAGGLSPIEPLRAIPNLPRRRIAAVTQGPAALPNEQGQVWREYDISPYTVRVTSTNRPEQAIVDWILRDTGYEAWHSEPLGILCANRRSVKVYHTPEMQAVVSDIVDRFVSSEAESQTFGLRVVTVGSPNWRSKAHPLLRPISVQTQGIQAWLLQKEDAALLLAELRKRMDFREQSSPHLLVNNGQTSIVTSIRPRSYVRDIIPKPQTWPNFEPEYAQFEEGYSLEFNPLLSLDGRTIDAVIKCNIDQLEKLVTVSLDVPSPAAPRQRAQLEVPQAIYCRLHERFRWPTDQVLLVGLGVVANPTPNDSHPLLKGLPLVSEPMRADLLVFVENKGRLVPSATAAAAAAAASGVPQTTQRDPRAYRGRY